MQTDQTRTKVRVADISGKGNHLDADINWNSFVRGKGYIKVQIGDKTAILKKEQLWTILFLLGDEKDHELLISPFVKLRKVVNYHKLIGVTALKDIKKGEAINIPLAFTLDTSTNRIIVGKSNAKSIEQHNF